MPPPGRSPCPDCARLLHADNLSYIEHIFEISRRPDLLTRVVEYRTQVLKISEEDEVDTKLTRIPSAKKYKGQEPPPPPRLGGPALSVRGLGGGEFLLPQPLALLTAAPLSPQTSFGSPPRKRSSNWPPHPKRPEPSVCMCACVGVCVCVRACVEGPSSKDHCHRVPSTALAQTLCGSPFAPLCLHPSLPCPSWVEKGGTWRKGDGGGFMPLPPHVSHLGCWLIVLRGC